MSTIVFGGLTGLLLGITMQAAGLTDSRRFRDMAALRHTWLLKAMLSFLGFGAMMTALLGWLAVLDVDLLAVRPLDGATLLGGVLVGAGVWLCGLLPGTALGSIGGGRLWEGLCAAAGCLVGALALPWVTGWVQPLHDAAWSRATVFRVTLDAPYLLPGSFLGLGILGLVLLAVAAYIPLAHAQQEQPAGTKHDHAAEPERAVQESMVAVLPNEEVLVVDTEEPMLNEDEIIAQEEIPEELPEEIDGDPEEEELDEPVMTDHPDLDPEPEEEDMTEALVDMEERVGIGTYVSEEAMPVNARVLVKPDAEAIGAVEEEKEESREPVGKA